MLQIGRIPWVPLLVKDNSDQPGNLAAPPTVD